MPESEQTEAKPVDSKAKRPGKCRTIAATNGMPKGRAKGKPEGQNEGENDEMNDDCPVGKSSRGNTRSERRAHQGGWVSGYLLALEDTGGNYTAAAETAGVTRQAVWQWRNSHPDFCEAEELAVKRAIRVLEAEAVRRASEGFVKSQRFDPKTGKLVYEERVYSDTLLLRLLERHDGAWRPANKFEHSGEIAGKASDEQVAETVKTLLPTLRDLCAAGRS